MFVPAPVVLLSYRNHKLAQLHLLTGAYGLDSVCREKPWHRPNAYKYVALLGVQ